MSDATQSPWTQLEPEPPEQKDRNIWVGVRLLVSSTIFLFLPFVFAFLYLASLNTSGLWRPGDLKAPLGFGLAILLAVVVCAGLVAWARSELVRGSEIASRWLSLVALVSGLVAVALQVVEYTRLDFGPTDGGWASVFLGWTGLYAVTVLCSMVWLETIVASTFRNGSRVRGSSQADLDAAGFYLAFLAGLGALTFAFLYLF